jgi:hypothetical protein
MAQTLVKLVKNDAGRVSRESLGGCRFVDLIGKHGFDENGADCS